MRTTISIPRRPSLRLGVPALALLLGACTDPVGVTSDDDAPSAVAVEPAPDCAEYLPAARSDANRAGLLEFCYLPAFDTPVWDPLQPGPATSTCSCVGTPDDR